MGTGVPGVDMLESMLELLPILTGSIRISRFNKCSFLVSTVRCDQSRKVLAEMSS